MTGAGGAAPAVCAVVVAGGSGTRFGGPKQFLPVGGRRAVDIAVATARSVATFVVLVLPASSLAEGAGAGADLVVAGGAARADSVRCGLAHVPPSASVVVVHDAARPLATPALFRSVVAAVLAGAAGAVPGVPVADTLKRVDGGSVVRSTVSREGLVAVQTPQAFRTSVLLAAHAAGANATDDAGLVEALGETVVVVAGDPRNLKLTSPDDLPLLEALAAGAGAGGDGDGGESRARSTITDEVNRAHATEAGDPRARLTITDEVNRAHAGPAPAPAAPPAAAVQQ